MFFLVQLLIKKEIFGTKGKVKPIYFFAQIRNREPATSKTTQ